MGYQLFTTGGYEFGDVVSALQKAIRRGEEPDAMFWALELYDKYSAALWTRLRVIANEDIGPANPMAAVYINAQADNYAAITKEGSHRLILANVILFLCRSPKSREADHFQCVVNQRRIQQGWKLEIPDHALDKHTRKGSQMGRSWDHWLEEGCKLSKWVGDDPYRAEATQLWKTSKKAPKGTLKTVPKKKGQPDDTTLFDEHQTEDA